MLAGYGLEMNNPTWIDRSVVGAVAGGVAITGSDQPNQTEWFGYGPTPLPRIPEPHPIWAPDGSAIGWEDATGVNTLNIVDLSGANCAANSTGKLISPTGSRPTWSAAPYDPQPDAGSGQRGGAPRFRLASSTSLRRALRSGIRLLVSCPAGCDATATATVDARTARRYKLGRLVARGSGHAGTSTALTLRLTARAKRHLRRASRLTVAVSVTYRDASGDTTRSRRTLTLR